MDASIIARRQLPNGRLAEVIPLTEGRARLCLIENSEGADYCYADLW